MQNFHYCWQVIVGNAYLLWPVLKGILDNIQSANKHFIWSILMPLMWLRCVSTLWYFDDNVMCILVVSSFPACLFPLSSASFPCQSRLILSSRSKYSAPPLQLSILSDWCLTLSPHRLVLSSVSDYFAAMFTSDVREAKQDEVKMEGVDPDALWVLVQYAYTGTQTHWLPL